MSFYLDAELEAWRGAGRPATAAQEAEDERKDAELLAAVRNSIHQWELKKARTRYYKLMLHYYQRCYSWLYLQRSYSVALLL